MRAGKFFAPRDAWISGADGFDRSKTAFEPHYFPSKSGASVEVPAGKIRVEVMKGFEFAFEKRDVEVGAGGAVKVMVKLREVGKAEKKEKSKPERAENLASCGPGAQQCCAHTRNGHGGECWVSSDLHVHMNYGGEYRNAPEHLVLQAEAENLGIVNNLIVNKEQRIPDIAYSGRPGGSGFEGAGDCGAWAGISYDAMGTSWAAEYARWDFAAGLCGLSGDGGDEFVADGRGRKRYGACAWRAGWICASLRRRSGDSSTHTRRYAGGTCSGRGARQSGLSRSRRIQRLSRDGRSLVSLPQFRVSPSGRSRDGRDGEFCFAARAGGNGSSVRTRASGTGTGRFFSRGAEERQNCCDERAAVGFFFGRGADRRRSEAGRREEHYFLGFVALDCAAGSLGACLLWSENGEREQRYLFCSGIEDECFARRGEAHGEVAIEKSGWCLVRASSDKSEYPILDNYVYATTSPIYVTVDGKKPTSHDDAEYFVKWMDRTRAMASGYAYWNSEAEKQTALDRLTGARKIYEGLK